MSLHDAPNAAPRTPLAHHMSQLRRAFIEAVSDDDMTAVARKLTEIAREGELPAIRLLLQYALGKPSAVIEAPPASRPLVPPAVPSPAEASPVAPAGRIPPGSPAGAELNAMILQQIAAHQRPAADTKRKIPDRSTPKGVSAGQGIARPEAMRLVNQP